MHSDNVLTFLFCMLSALFLSISLSQMVKFYFILLDFLLTVKAVILIFISGHGSAISSAQEGKSVLFNM